MSYSLCALLPPPVTAGSPAFAEDGLCWLLLLAITLFDLYLLYEVVRLRRRWVLEDARARADGRATSAAAYRLAQKPRSVSNYSPCPAGL
jgi:hypothetical protein